MDHEAWIKIIRKLLLLNLFTNVLAMSADYNMDSESSVGYKINIMSRTRDSEAEQDGKCVADCPINKQSPQTLSLGEKETIHGAHISEVHNVPMSVIIRPIPSVLDEEKLLSIMTTLQVSTELVTIIILLST